MPQYRVGQMFWHKQFKYRGVVIGWDAQSRYSAKQIRGPGWAKLELGVKQPWYYTLRDSRDNGDRRLGTLLKRTSKASMWTLQTLRGCSPLRPSAATGRT